MRKCQSSQHSNLVEAPKEFLAVGTECRLTKKFRDEFMAVHFVDSAGRKVSKLNLKEIIKSKFTLDAEQAWWHRDALWYLWHVSFGHKHHVLAHPVPVSSYKLNYYSTLAKYSNLMTLMVLMTRNGKEDMNCCRLSRVTIPLRVGAVLCFYFVPVIFFKDIRKQVERIKIEKFLTSKLVFLRRWLLFCPLSRCALRFALLPVNSIFH